MWIAILNHITEIQHVLPTEKKNQWEKETWIIYLSVDNSGCYIPNTIVSVLVINKRWKHAIPLSSDEMISIYK